MTDHNQDQNEPLNEPVKHKKIPNSELELDYNDTASEAANQASSAKKTALIVVVLILILVVIYTLLDRMAPSSSRGMVSAHVVQVSARVSGQVTDVMVEDNAVVQAGDALFALDSRPYTLAVEQAEANLKTALQNVNASGASLVAAQADVTKARLSLENARTELGRIERLESRGVISASEADNTRNRVANAEAQLDSAKANLQSARKQLGSQGMDNPAILAAEAALEQAQYDLASTTITAPHLGVVTNINMSEGQFIAAGNPAMTFIDAKAAWITVDLRENQLQHINAGDEARLLFDVLPGQLFTGRVQSVAWGINPGRNVQGGLVVNQPNNRWFEPARRIPVRVELDTDINDWPENVPVGGKVDVVILADGQSHPIAWLARSFQRVRSWFSYLH